MTITAESMKDKLLSVDTLREILAKTEPLTEHPFTLDASLPVSFTLPDGWNLGLKEKPGSTKTDASLSLDGDTFSLTKDAVLAATSLIGLTKDYVSKTPGHLVMPHLNYHMGHMPTKEIKLLAREDEGLAFTKASIKPFSNLDLLDKVLDGIDSKYGKSDVMVDYKLHHDLRQTAFRVIVPDNVTVIKSGRSGGVEDVWSTGIQVRQSIIGEKALQLQGYLFAYWCTNGAVSTHASSGAYNRRTQGQTAGVYDWARQSVDEILGDLEHELLAVEDLTKISVAEDINVVLTDLFQTYKIPTELREAIILHMVESDDLTMYGVMQAITQAANNANISENVRIHLMEIGGDIPANTSDRCSHCHRLPI